MNNELLELKDKFVNKSIHFIAQERVIIDTNNKYGNCTTGTQRKIIAAVKPISDEEIQLIVKIANELKLRIYPISTGRNWGYGSSLPVTDNCIILDLSLMNKITDFDATMGWVKIQPGVTQKDLRDFLDKIEQDGGPAFMVPTSGAGPYASLLGNIMERGYGITPHKDHFDALISLKVILPNGDIYKSMMNEFGGEELENNFKWGIGPYLNGLFTQSNLGIVTEVTISLAKRPECIAIFKFDINADEDLGFAVEAVREINQELGSMVSGINLMNQHRVLSMKIEGDIDKSKIMSTSLLDEKELSFYAKKYGVAKWTGIGALYGKKEVVQAAKKIVKRKLKKVSRPIFINSTTVTALNSIIEKIPSYFIPNSLASLFKSLVKLKDILEGKPNEVAIPLVYWKSSQSYNERSAHSLHEDNCGLIWYAPLVVIKKESVDEYIKMATRVCRDYGVEPLITLTSVSDRCFDSTIPILFDKSNLNEMENAKKCYEALFNEGKARGFFPYRLNIDTMGKLFQSSNPTFKLLTKIKETLDPNHILSPGRYSVAKK